MFLGELTAYTKSKKKMGDRQRSVSKKSNICEEGRIVSIHDTDISLFFELKFHI